MQRRELTFIPLMALLAALPATASAQLVADAGEDLFLGCVSPGGTEVTLDGTGSSMGPNISYLWTTDPAVELDDPTSLTPVGTFPTGTATATLTVSDSSGGMASDAVEITVTDETPPVAKVWADPHVLWPPNHELHEIDVRVRTHDVCAPPGTHADLTVELVSVESDEADNGTGDGNTTDDIQGADIGEDDRSILLRAERSGNADGRIYTLTYRITDRSGNTTDAVAQVHVPHDFADLMRLLGHERPDDIGLICPSPLPAVSEWLDALPRPRHFSSERSCVQACRTWGMGCRDIGSNAGRCVAAQLQAEARLEAIECRELTDSAEARACTMAVRDEAREATTELRMEDRAARDMCAGVASRCANHCHEAF